MCHVPSYSFATSPAVLCEKAHFMYYKTFLCVSAQLNQFNLIPSLLNYCQTSDIIKNGKTCPMTTPAPQVTRLCLRMLDSSVLTFFRWRDIIFQSTLLTRRGRSMYTVVSPMIHAHSSVRVGTSITANERTRSSSSHASKDYGVIL